MKNIWLMLIAYIAMLIVNALATTGNLNGQSTSEISNRLTVLFTPAGYVFSIWGVIYFLLAIWLYLQFKNKEQQTQSISTLFIASCVLNILWLVTWHYEWFVASVLIMLLLLVTLIAIYKEYSVEDDRFGGRLPFSFYLGWISVATIANISYTLKYNDVSLGISEPVGTVVLLIVAAVLAIAGRYISKDSYFALVFVFAIVGIGTKNSDELVSTAAYIVAIVILLAILVISFLFDKKQET